MKMKYSMAKNLVLSSLSTMSYVFLFILLTTVGKVSGSYQYGIYTTALSLANIFEIFTDFGLRDTSVRNVARNKLLTGDYLGGLLIWKGLLSLLTFLLVYLLIHLMGYASDIRLIIYILTISAFLKNYKYTLRSFLQIHDYFQWDTFLVFIERFGLMTVGLAVILKWKVILPLAIGTVIVRIIDVGIILYLLNSKIAPIRLKTNFPFMLTLQKEAFPLGLYFLIVITFSYIDSVMLSLIKTYHHVGLYNAAFRIYEGATLLPSIFWMVFLPRLSELYPIAKERYLKLSFIGIKFLILFALPIVSYGYLFSDKIIIFFFNNDFLPAIITLKILLLGLLFQYLSWMLNAILISMDRQKAIFALGGIALAVKVALNSLFIPSMANNGAALATFISEFAFFTAVTIYLKLIDFHLPILRFMLKPLLAALAMYFVGFRITNWPLPLVIFICGLIYFISLFLTKAIDQGELQSLQKYWKSAWKS